MLKNNSLSESVIIKYQFALQTILITTIIILYGCTTPTNLAENISTTSPQPTLQASVTEPRLSRETPPPTSPISVATILPALTSMSTPFSTANFVTPTTEFIETPEGANELTIQGHIFSEGIEEGIWHMSLPDGILSNLQTKAENWSFFRVSFARNNDNIAYWTRDEEKSELWMTSLTEWSPKLLLQISEPDYDAVSLQWLVNDSYLFVGLAILEKPHNNIKIIESYLFTNQGEQIEVEGLIEGCPILALSPQSNRVAVWCPLSAEEENTQFVVLEQEQALWIANSESETVIAEDSFLRENPWVWSPDGQYIAYTESVNQFLFYTPVDDLAPIKLNDEFTSSYTFLAWSPDGQYLSYTGRCQDGRACKVIMDIYTQEVIWDSHASGLEHIGEITWSPDSKYIVASIYDDNSNPRTQLVFIDLVSGQQVLQIPGTGISFRIIWLRN